MTRDPVRADDLYHQAVVVGLQRIDQLSAEAAFRAWMSRIVYRTHLNDRRRDVPVEARTEPLGDNVVSLAGPGPHDALEAASSPSARRRAPRPPRRPGPRRLAGRRAGLQFREAAEILDVPRGTAATLAFPRKRLQAFRDLAPEPQVQR
ncbi:MAG: hypothetical protein R3F59_28385 [Myxococcota bacterium]